MRRRSLCAAGALACSLLAVASVAGASEPVKRYTVPAGPQSIVSPGKLTVLLPARWEVLTQVKYGSTRALDPAHRASGAFAPYVSWRATTRLMPRGTTLDDVRRQSSFRGRREAWGIVVYQVGDTFLNLRAGKVWRQSVLAFAPKGDGWDARAITRDYWLDRGVVREARSGAARQLFSVFTVQCRHQWCREHNGQFAAIMRSIRLAP